MSPWLFDVYMNDVVKEKYARMIDRSLSLMNDHNREWDMNQFLFADDIGLVTDLEERLR